jgi:hypothetical protein
MLPEAKHGLQKGAPEEWFHMVHCMVQGMVSMDNYHHLLKGRSILQFPSLHLGQKGGILSFLYLLY